MDADVRRIADDGVEAASLHDGLELHRPVEGVNAHEVFGHHREIGGDEGVAALDVVLQGREQGNLGRVAQEFALALEGGAVLVLQHLEVERELGDFHGGAVQVHAVDVVGEDQALEMDGEVQVAGGFIQPAELPVALQPFRPLVLDLGGVNPGTDGFLLVLLPIHRRGGLRFGGDLRGQPAQPVFAHALEGADEERAGTAGGIKQAQGGGLFLEIF